MLRLPLALALTLLVLSPALLWAGHQDIAAHTTCRFCGMDRQQFSHSRMLIHYEDGSQTPLCSLRCAAVELAGRFDQRPAAIEVADFDRRELLEAEWAYWVVGGRKPGVMSHRAKWAFGTRKAAEGFIADQGGELVGFEQALEAAYADLYQDSKVLRQRREQPAKASGHHHPGPAPATHQGHHH